MYKVLSLCFGLLLTGCSVGSHLEPIPVEPSRSYNADFERTWDAAVTALTELNFPITTMDKDTGLINTGQLETANGFGIESAHLYGIRKFEASLKEIAVAKLLILRQGDKTNVRLIVTISELFSDGYKQVESKGVLEKKILDSIASRLIS